MKPNGTVFSEQFLLDSLAEFEQSQFFKDFLAARQQSFLFSPEELDDAQHVSEPVEVDTNINPQTDQVNTDAAERVAGMSDEQKRELVSYVESAPAFITFPPDVLAMVELIRAEEQQKALQLSAPARYLMNTDNMPMFVDKLVAGDEMSEIADRILNNGEDAATVARDFITGGRHNISDHETFEVAVIAVQPGGDGVTFTTEPDSAHPFSISYSWEQIGEYFRTAAQLVRDIEREAQEAYERDIAENMEAYDALDHHRDVYLSAPDDNNAAYPITDARKKQLHNYRLHFEPDQGYLLLADSDTEQDLMLHNFTMVGSSLVLHGVQGMGFTVTGVEPEHAEVSEQETETDSITIQVYQLPPGERYHGIRYFSLADNADADLTITDYDLTLEISAETLAEHGFKPQSTTNGTLERIMQTVNGMDITPHRTQMHHDIAMSDVIVLTVNGQQTAYYCDTVGFTEMPDFFREKLPEQTEDFSEQMKMLEVKARAITSPLYKMIDANMDEQSREQLRAFAADHLDNIVLDTFGSDDAFIQYYFGEQHDSIVDSVFNAVYDELSDRKSRIYEITFYYDGDTDEGRDFASLEDAIAYGMSRTGDEARGSGDDFYDGFAVLDKQAHKIVAVRGEFPSSGVFSEEVYRNSGMIVEQTEPEEVDTNINISDDTKLVAAAFGVDAEMLQRLRDSGRTADNLNEYGRFSALTETADRSRVRQFFEQAGLIIPPHQLAMRRDSVLRHYVLEGTLTDAFRAAAEKLIAAEKPESVTETEVPDAAAQSPSESQGTKKTDDTLHSTGLSLPEENTHIGSNDSIAHSSEIVNTPDEDSRGHETEPGEVDTNINPPADMPQETSSPDELSDFVREQNRKVIEGLEVGDSIGLPDGNYTVIAINGDFKIDLRSDETDSISSRIGNWKEMLLNEAGDTPISVVKAAVVQQLSDAETHEVDTNINPERIDTTEQTPAKPDLRGLDQDTQEYIMTGHITGQKRSLTRPERLYRLFARMYPEIVSGEHEYERHEAANGERSGYEPLAVESHGGGQYSWTTFYIQNGDLMSDPDFCFILDHEHQRLEILSYQQDGAPPHGTDYQCCIDNTGNVDERLRARLESLFEFDLRNAMEANRQLVRYIDAEGNSVDLRPEHAEPTPEPEEPETQEPEAGEPIPEIVYAADAASRASDNLAAIRELIRLREAERRGEPLYETSHSKYAHTKELSDATLRRYCGWGGLSHVFDEPEEDLDNDRTVSRLRSTMSSEKFLQMMNFHRIRSELKKLLTPEEYAAAKASSTDSFYTPQYIIDAMYRAVQSMGLRRDSRVLEPSCGTGNFIARMPHAIGNGGVVGIEIDTITAEIAARLTADQKHIQIIHSPFERAGQPNDSFDLVIGNVPFGSYCMNDPDYAQDWLIHDAFFRKALDKVAPGGVVAFVTSSGTLDKKNPKVREFLAQQAELIGAIRLPNTAFSETGVTTDIIFLKKREVPLQAHEPKPDWCYTAPDENGLMINSYFIQNPHMMLGTMRRTTFQDRLTCDPVKGADLEKQLNEAIKQLRATVTVKRREQETLKLQGMIEPWGRDYSYHEKDGKIYYRAGDEMSEVKGSKKKLDMLRRLIELRTLTRELIDKQKTHISDEELEPMRQKLNELYDAFRQIHGELNSAAVKRAFGQDMDYPLLQSLEEYNKDTATYEKADIFKRRTVNPVAEISAVETLEEAYQVSLDRRGKPDIPYMATLLQGSRPDKPFTELVQEVQTELLEKGMVFIDPEQEVKGQPFSGIVDRAEYLSGNVRRKLAFAEEAAQTRPEFQRNADALREVLPADIQAEEITVRMGCSWIDPEDYTEFLRTLADRSPRDTRCDVTYSPVTGEFDIMNAGSQKDLNVNESTTYGTPELTMYEIAEKILNQRRIAVMKSVPSPKDPTKTVSRTDPAATKRALEKAKMIEAKFVEWIFADPARREKYVRRYNELFNSLVGRSYDGSGLTFDGMASGFTLRQHQKNCVARAVYGGNALAAHVVGAGKSAVFITTVMKKKALGLIHKACVVVPKALTEQTAREWRKLYPDARLLTVTDMDLSSQKKRDVFAARIATGDFDAVILSQEQFEKMPMSPEFQKAYIQKQLDALEDMLRERRIANGNRRDTSTKAIETEKKRLKRRLEKIMNPKSAPKKKDFLLDFEQLGFDFLVVDEAHAYKNGFVATKMGEVSGVTTKASGRAQDMQMKCDFLNDTMGQGHIMFCTGTPVSNSMTELYVMSRYLRPDLLAAAGVSRFDDWAATFGRVVMQHKQTASGELKLKATFAKFANLPELMALYKEFADIQSAKKLDLPRPALKTGKPQIIKVEATPEQRDYVRFLAERAKRIASGTVDPHEDNPLVITSEARMLGLGNAALAALMRKHDLEVPDDLAAAKDSKVDACIDKVMEIYHATTEQKGVQIIFSDIAVNAGEEGFSVYDYIRDELIRRGVPAEEIVFAPKADSKNRADIFRDINDGKYRVVIASTGTLGTGANIQQRLAALHHIDIPWKPSDFEQREGRILRQGNMFPEVQIFNYITEGTLDSYLYQVVTDKARFIAQLLDDECPARVSEDCDEKVLTFGELQAAAEGNQDFKKRIELANEIAELRLARAEHMREIAKLRVQIEQTPEKIIALQERLLGIKSDISDVDKMRDSSGKLHGITITTAVGKQISEREKINDYLHSLIQQKLKNPFNDVPEFMIGGFRVSVQLGKSQDEIVFVMKGESPAAYKTTAGQSDKQDNCQRLMNLLDGGIAKDAEKVSDAITKLQTDLEQAKARVDTPFAYEQRLAEAVQELAEVEKALTGISDMEDALIDPDEEAAVETADQKNDREEFFTGDPSDINPNTDSGFSDDDSEDTPPTDTPPVPPIR